MSAGTSCILEITFTPQVDEDIFGELPLLAATGPFSVPIECTTKKVVPSISTKHVQFDHVVMGETATFSLVVKNAGALPTTYEFFDPKTGLAKGLTVKTTPPPSPRGALSPASPTTTALLSPASPGSPDGFDDGALSPAPDSLVEAIDDSEEAEAVAEAALLEKASAVGAAALQYRDRA